MTLATSLGPIVIASLLGSLHCVGMCGGLVSFYAGSGAGARATRWAPHAAYHLTRLAAYMLLGASAGQLGAALDVVGGRFGLAGLGALSAGAAILGWGVLSILGRQGRPRLLQPGRAPSGPPKLWRRLESYLATLAHRARQRPPLWRASVLGVSSALLPCGWLYAFAVLAAGTGSAGRGALLLAAFWSGTVPALLGLGLGIERISQTLRAFVPRLSAVLLILVGIFNVASRWPLHLSGQSAASAAGTPSCHAEH